MHPHTPTSGIATPLPQRRLLAARMLALATLIPSLVLAQTALRIDLSQPGVPVSPTLYGQMTEEINYSYDGGLYAELVRNRVFKDDDKTPVHWSVVHEAGGSAAEYAGGRRQHSVDVALTFGKGSRCRQVHDVTYQ